MFVVTYKHQSTNNHAFQRLNWFFVDKKRIITRTINNKTLTSIPNLAMRPDNKTKQIPTGIMNLLRTPGHGYKTTPAFKKYPYRSQ